MQGVALAQQQPYQRIPRRERFQLRKQTDDCPINALALDKICRRLASGRTLTSVMADTDLPTYDDLMRVCQEKPEIAQAVARAREQSAHALASQTVDLADKKADLRWQVQTRMWLAGKYNSQYSDKAAGVSVNISLEKLITDASTVGQVVENTPVDGQQALEAPKDTR